MHRVLLAIGFLQVLIILAGVLRSKGLSVLLGPSGFGIVSTIDQVVLTLVHLGALGLPFTALRYMARSHSDGRKSFRRISSSFTRALVVMAVTTAAAGSAALAWQPGIFGADFLAYRSSLQLALLGIPGVMLGVLFVNMLAAAQRPTAGSVLNLVIVSGLALAAVIGVMWNGVDGLYIATAIVGSLIIAGAAVYLRSALGLRFSGNSVGLVRELRKTPEIISSTAYIYLVMSAYSLSLLVIRYVVLSRIDETAAGFLQASLSIALAVGSVLNPMSNLYLTPLVNLQTSQVEKVHIAHVFAARMLVLLLIGSLPVVLFPRVILELLFTSEFAPATMTLFLFVLWQCVYQVANVYQQLLLGLDDVPFITTMAAVGYCAAAGLTLLLVPIVGLGGAPLALTAGTVFYGLAAAVRLRRLSIEVPFRLAMRTAFVITVVVMAGLFFGAGGETSGGEIGLRFGYGIASLGGMWVLLEQDERRLVRRGPSAFVRSLGVRDDGSSAIQ